jgi:2-polyprenyl-3-methyl-5-hydroxy-6-metoxy-1,4-benzoquinol methylase
MKTPIDPLHERLYGAYASQHAHRSDGEATALIYRRDIRPMLLAPTAGPVLDIGCGQGQLVRLMLEDGYDATGIDVSLEQVAIAQVACLDRIQHGDYRDVLDARAGQFAAVTAADVLEHLTKAEVLDTFDRVARALIPGGVFVARVPNAASPFGGRIRWTT